MNIPEEAVEAAAASIQVRAGRSVNLSDMARAVLEAALPHIEKDAYERGWGAGFRHHKESAK